MELGLRAKDSRNQDNPKETEYLLPPESMSLQTLLSKAQGSRGTGLECLHG